MNILACLLGHEHPGLFGVCVGAELLVVGVHTLSSHCLALLGSAPISLPPQWEGSSRSTSQLMTCYEMPF